MKTFIIIPCYNEEGNIANVLTELNNITDSYKVIIVNDCSTDNTSTIANSFANACIIDLPINLGVGGAVQTGFILSQKENADFAVKMDGDGQHTPSYIEDLLTPLKQEQADIVIGSRFLTDNVGFKSTFLRRIGIKLLQLVCQILTGHKITDPTSGFRAYNKRALNFMAENYPSFDYPEPEEIILAIKNNLRIVEVPIMMRPRQYGNSTITSLGSIYYMIKVTLSMIFTQIR